MAGLMKPNDFRWNCCAAATIPATSGEASEVPPSACVTYPTTAPLLSSSCSSIRMPVNGSASALMSGSARTRPRCPLSPAAGGVASAFGTMPFWEDGCDQSRLQPPPVASEPNSCQTVEPNCWPTTFVDQPVSNSRLPVLPMPSEVPPTAIAYGSTAGSDAPG